MGRRHSTDSDPESEDERVKVVKRNPAIREDEPKNGNRMSAKDMFAREERNGRLSNARDKVRDGGESRGRQSAREGEWRESRSISRDRRVRRSISRERRMNRSRSRSRERKRSTERRKERSRSKSRERKRERDDRRRR